MGVRQKPTKVVAKRQSPTETIKSAVYKVESLWPKRSDCLVLRKPPSMKSTQKCAECDKTIYYGGSEGLCAPCEIRAAIRPRAPLHL